ncbi:hypothetical protein [Embleya sp. NBC_00896]|uniref:hypothetical protein n=1 Tax=Embleya sp. NBC_00896 TaxID=2975961 RepID=UPI00386B420B|nr:hypothetical protein OG928_00530 [Embleya sp. NBC_00896]
MRFGRLHTAIAVSALGAAICLVGSPAQAATESASVSCVVHTNQPTYNPSTGNIIATGSLSCPSRVSRATINVAVYRDGSRVGSTEKTGRNVSYLSDTALATNRSGPVRRTGARR